LRKSEIDALLQEISPRLDGYSISADMLVRGKSKYAMCAFQVETHQRTRSDYYMWAFWVPLCVPIDNLHYTYGERVRGKHGDLWTRHVNDNSIIDDMRRSERSVFPPADDPECIYQEIIKVPNYSQHVILAKAHVAACNKKFVEAKNYIKQLNEAIDLNIAWHLALLNKARSLDGAIDAGSDAVVLHLDSCSRRTLAMFR
jgi:hypothetical protein